MMLLPSPASDTAEYGAAPELAPLRVGMMITSVEAAAGGVPEATRSLTRALNGRCDTDVEIFSMSEPDPAAHRSWGGAGMHYHAVRGPRSFAYAPSMARSIDRRSVDLLHLHGLWQYSSVATRNWTVRTGRPSLISPHGMLDAWALNNSRRKKRIASYLFENDNLVRASCLHALCGQELQAIRDCGLVNPVCVIPNGVDPAPTRIPGAPEWRRLLGSDARVLLYLGRLHPKKNLIELLRAWRSVRADTAESGAWHLVIAGSGAPDYERRLHEEIGRLGLAATVHLIGAQYGPAKHAAFAWSNAFVLPSLSEGLPMAALEAWSWGLPALLTPECNLPEGCAAGAALPMKTDRDGIAAAIGRLFGLEDERRREAGRQGLQLTSTRFAWTRIAEEFRSVYGWLAGIRERPESVASI